MTVLMKNNEDANAFAATRMPKQRKPLESKRMNTYAWRDSHTAVNRKNNVRSDRVSGWSTDIDKMPRVRASVTRVFSALQQDLIYQPDIQQSQVRDTCTL